MGKWVHKLEHVNLNANTAICTECGTVSLTFKQGRPFCSIAVKLRKHRAKVTRRATAIQIANACEICGLKTNLVMDHCHKTNVDRGILCSKCNLMLGFARDNPDILRAGADYLEG